MMNVMVKTAGKGLANKIDRTPEEDDMLDMLVNGRKRVTLQNLNAVTEWYIWQTDWIFSARDLKVQKKKD